MLKWIRNCCFKNQSQKTPNKHKTKPQLVGFKHLQMCSELECRGQYLYGFNQGWDSKTKIWDFKPSAFLLFFLIFFPMFDFTLGMSTSKDSVRGHLRLEKACQGIMTRHQHFCLQAFLIQENHDEKDLICHPNIPLGFELREPESSRFQGHWGSESCQGDHIRAPVLPPPDLSKLGHPWWWDEGK